MMSVWPVCDHMSWCQCDLYATMCHGVSVTHRSSCPDVSVTHMSPCAMMSMWPMSLWCWPFSQVWVSFFHSHLSAVSSCAVVRNGLFQVYGLIRGSSRKKKKRWQFCSEVSVSVWHWSVLHIAFKIGVWPWSVFHIAVKMAVWPVSVSHCVQNGSLTLISVWHCIQNGSLTLISVSHCSKWQSDLDQCFTLHSKWQSDLGQCSTLRSKWQSDLDQCFTQRSCQPGLDQYSTLLVWPWLVFDTVTVFRIAGWPWEVFYTLSLTLSNALHCVQNGSLTLISI